MANVIVTIMQRPQTVVLVDVTAKKQWNYYNNGLFAPGTRLRPAADAFLTW